VYPFEILFQLMTLCYLLTNLLNKLPKIELLQSSDESDTKYVPLVKSNLIKYTLKRTKTKAYPRKI